MKFEDLKFMSIGSNCGDIFFLGKNRVRGPIDNVNLYKGLINVDDVLSEKLLQDVISKNFDEIERRGQKVYRCRETFIEFWHNNPNEEKFLVEFKRRYDNLRKALKDESFYFTYNPAWTDSKDGKNLENSFYKGLQVLERYGIKDRVILTNCINPNEDVKNVFHPSSGFKGEYLLQITLDGISRTNTDEIFQQFKEKVIKLLNLEG